jgi:hypothetical protein
VGDIDGDGAARVRGGMMDETDVKGCCGILMLIIAIVITMILLKGCGVA